MVTLPIPGARPRADRPGLTAPGGPAALRPLLVLLVAIFLSLAVLAGLSTALLRWA